MPVPLWRPLEDSVNGMVEDVGHILEDLEMDLMQDVLDEGPIADFREKCDLLQSELEDIYYALDTIKLRHNAERHASQYIQDGEEGCSICYEEFSIPCDWKTICGHAFHKDCIFSYFLSCEVKAACPYCRIPIVAEDFSGEGVFNLSTEASWIICNRGIRAVCKSLDKCTQWIESAIGRCTHVLEASEAGASDLTALISKLLLHTMRNPFENLDVICSNMCRELAKFRGLRIGMDAVEAMHFEGF